MNSDAIATLQAAADAIAPGLAKITLDVRSEEVFEPDLRPGKAGRNRLTPWSPCVDCKATGEVADAQGLPLVCATCLGHKEVQGDAPRAPHPHVMIDLGHSTRQEIGVLDGKGRVDQRRERTLDELLAIVRTQLGYGAIQNLAGRDQLAPARVKVLADAAIAAGIDPARVQEHVARRADKTSAPAHVAARMLVATCAGCGARTSGENVAAVRASCPGGKCGRCGSTVVFTTVTRDASGAEIEA